MGGIETAEVQDEMASEAIAAPPVKKITLNFNGLAGDSVQQMAAATCADPDAEEKFQRRMSSLKASFDELANSHKNCTEMMGAGAAYLTEVNKTYDTMSEALDELARQPAKPSLLARIMGKGNAAKQAMDNIRHLAGTCKDAVDELDRSLEGVRAAMKEQKKILDDAFDVVGPEGNISPEMALALRSSVHAVEESSKQFHELTMASNAVKMNFGTLASKVVQISINQMTMAGP
ncbi:MAG: hypothetical protein ACAH80_14395 [Alphaproteobacteria bacterium]